MERGEVNTVAQYSTHYAPFRHTSNATYRFCILFFLVHEFPTTLNGAVVASHTNVVWQTRVALQ